MTPQEQQMLQGLIDRVRNTRLPEKDTEAEQALQSSLGQNADALYILAQTVLVQEYALHQAQQQLAQLRAQNDQMRQQAAAPARHTSFLGSLLGRDEDTSRQPPPPPPVPASTQPGYTPVPNYPGSTAAPAPYAQPGYGAYGYAPQGGGFLRSALQTATGVAAGALAFEGVESLMHGFGHAAGYGSEFMPVGGFGGGAFGNAGPREEVINNYYGNAGPGSSGSLDTTAGGSDHASSGDSGSFLPTLDQSSGDNNDIWSQSENVPAPQNASDFDSADSRGNAGFDTADSTSGTDDTSNFDDGSGAGLDDNAGGFDDNSGGGFDDSGSGFDDSGSGFDDNSGGF